MTCGFSIPSANVKRAVAKKARRSLKKRRGPLESEIQRSVVDWLALHERMGRLMYFHIPNGGQRNVIVAAKLKRLGTRKGVPDLCIISPNGPVCFVELKSAGGSLSSEQKAWIAALDICGCPTRVCRSLDEVRQFLFETGVIREVA